MSDLDGGYARTVIAAGKFTNHIFVSMGTKVCQKQNRKVVLMGITGNLEYYSGTLAHRMFLALESPEGVLKY